MYTIPLGHASLSDSFKHTPCGDGSHFTALGRPKRTGCLSGRIDANIVCSYHNKSVLIDEENQRTAVVHNDGLWHGEVKPNCVFQPHTKEDLAEIKKKWKEYQETSSIVMDTKKVQNVVKGVSKTRSGKVLAKFPPEHIEKISDSLKEVVAFRDTEKVANPVVVEDSLADFDVITIEDADVDWELVDGAKLDKEYVVVLPGATDGAIVRKVL